MKRHVTALVLVCGIVGAFSAGIYWLKIQDTPGCALQTESPADQFIAGPFLVDREWEEIRLKQPLQTFPDIQNLFIHGNSQTHKILDRAPGLVELPLASFQPLDGGKAIIFEVTLITEQGLEIPLLQNTRGHLQFGKESVPAIGFGIAHPDWEKIYFSPDLLFKAIKIRASGPIELQSMSWVASSFYRDPCRVWADVSVQGIFESGDPQPQRGRVTIDDEIPPVVDWERKPSFPAR